MNTVGAKTTKKKDQGQIRDFRPKYRIKVIYSLFATMADHNEMKKKCNQNNPSVPHQDFIGSKSVSNLPTMLFDKLVRNTYFLNHHFQNDNPRVPMILSYGGNSLDNNSKNYSNYSSYKKAIELINEHRSKESASSSGQRIPINPATLQTTDAIKKEVHQRIQEQDAAFAKRIGNIYDDLIAKTNHTIQLIRGISHFYDVHIDIEGFLPVFSFAYEFKKQCESEKLASIDKIEIFELPKVLDLQLERKKLEEYYTEGQLNVKGQYQSSYHKICDTIEDKDRGLKDSYQGIDGTKIVKGIKSGSSPSSKNYGVTAIPRGNYKVSNQFSDKFSNRTLYKSYYDIYHLNNWSGKMPNVVNTKGFSGILFHYGANAEKSEGCILLGAKQAAGSLQYYGSFKYWVDFMNILQPAIDNGYTVSLTIILNSDVSIQGTTSIKTDNNDIQDFLDSVKENKPQKEIAENFQKVLSTSDYKQSRTLQDELDSVFGQAINRQDSAN